MSRRKRLPSQRRVNTVFQLDGDDAVDEFKAVCAAYGLTPKELVHKLVTENISDWRSDAFRAPTVLHCLEYLRASRRRVELRKVQSSWDESVLTDLEQQFTYRDAGARPSRAHPENHHMPRKPITPPQQLRYGRAVVAAA